MDTATDRLPDGKVFPVEQQHADLIATTVDIIKKAITEGTPVADGTKVYAFTRYLRGMSWGDAPRSRYELLVVYPHGDNLPLPLSRAIENEFLVTPILPNNGSQFVKVVTMNPTEEAELKMIAGNKAQQIWPIVTP